MAKPPTPAPLALAKIDLEEKTLEVKLRLKGKPAVDLMDYRRAHQALNDHKSWISSFWCSRCSQDSWSSTGAFRRGARPIRR